MVTGACGAVTQFVHWLPGAQGEIIVRRKNGKTFIAI